MASRCTLIEIFWQNVTTFFIKQLKFPYKESGDALFSKFKQANYYFKKRSPMLRLSCQDPESKQGHGPTMTTSSTQFGIRLYCYYSDNLAVYALTPSREKPFVAVWVLLFNTWVIQE